MICSFYCFSALRCSFGAIIVFLATPYIMYKSKNRCKDRHLSFHLTHLCKKTFTFALEFNDFYMRNILSLLVLSVFSAINISAQVHTQEVDSAYLVQIENMIAEAELDKAIVDVNAQMLSDEMKFEYENLIPLVYGFVSTYTRHDFVTKHPAIFEHTNSSMKDYAVAGSPLVAAWILKAAGVKSRSTTRRMLASNAFSLVLAAGLTEGTKHIVKEDRPDLRDNHSFPSGHTALAYVGATVLSREFGHHSPWITVGAYGAATATSLLRIKHNSHWLNDVYMGAGIGVVSTNVGYWLADRIFGEEGINKPQMTRRDMERYLKMSGTPSSIALVASSDIGKNTINADNLIFSDAMSSIRDEEMHVHLSSFTLAGVEASWFVNPYVAVEAIAQSSVGQAKVYSNTNNLFTGNTVQMYRGSLALKGSVPVPNTGTRMGLRVLAGMRNVGSADFYLNDGETFNPNNDYKITLPRETKFEIGCGFNYDVLEGKSHVVGFNFDYYHAFSKVTPNRFLLSTVYKILF